MKRRSQKKNEPVSQVNEPSGSEGADSGVDEADCAPGDQVVVSHGADLTSIDENHPLSAPINDLARAFAMQAEMLKVLHENQTEIMRTMKNDGRSEMMLNSTKALNDTFRGVKEVQEGLIERLGSSEGRGGPSAWLMAGFLLVFLLVSGGSLYWVLSSGLLVVGDSEATIKKLYLRNDEIELRPANRTLDPVIYSVDRVRIQGVVVGVMRKYNGELL